MSIPITRTLNPASYNIEVLTEEIAAGVAKYIAVQDYQYDTYVMTLEVEATWAGADDTELDAVISAHTNPPPAVDVVAPFPVNFGGENKGWVEKVNTALAERGGFVYPGTDALGVHTKALVMATGFGPGYYRVRVVDISNGSTEVFNIQKVRDLDDEWEIAEVSLPTMPTKPAMFAVQLASGGAGTTAYLTSITFM